VRENDLFQNKADDHLQKQNKNNLGLKQNKGKSFKNK
jgi:hypothetical protein